jgi:AcrR family transcriptional regulator
MLRKPSATPRKQPKQERSQATVEAILTATTHILIKEGYDQFNTNRVAELAGVSIGSLYQYFPNKEALLFALAEDHANEMVQLVQCHLEDLNDTSIPRVISQSRSPSRTQRTDSPQRADAPICGGEDGKNVAIVSRKAVRSN